jgi:triphosphatase
MGHELELKFEVPRARLLALVKSPWLRRLTKEPPRTRKLISVYYDTKSQALRERDITLRVRRDGDRYIQTVKSRAAKALDRCEWENQVEGEKPNRLLARQSALKAFTDKKHWRKLRPLFETAIFRTVLEVEEGQSRIALALDHGTIKAYRRRRPVSEVELELQEGSASDLLMLSRKLGARLPLALGIQSKAERGYALADGEPATHHKASAIPLVPDLTAEDGFRAIAMACLAHAGANKDAILDGDSEAVHQMRVGLRRLRSALSLFKPMIEGAETDAIKADLKWLSEQFGSARDFDVLAENSVKPMLADDPGDAGMEALKDDVAERRRKGMRQACQAVESDRYREILLQTGLWILGGVWTSDRNELRRAWRGRPICCSARDILDARTAKVTKKLKKFDKMNDRQRHKLRIAVKKLRYATGFFDALFPGHGKKQKRFVAALERLQSALGRLNDIRVHASFADDTVGRARSSRKGTAQQVARAYGLGQLTADERSSTRTCRKEARRAAKAFSALKPYWT